MVGSQATSTLRVEDPVNPLDVANKRYVDASGGAIEVVKTVDESRTTDDTMTDDAVLLFEALANKVYQGRLVLYVTAHPTPDMKVAFTLPAGASGFWNSDQMRGVPSSTVDITTPLVLTTGGTAQIMVYQFRIEMGGTAGTVNFQWAQNVSDGAATIVNLGSSLKVLES